MTLKEFLIRNSGEYLEEGLITGVRNLVFALGISIGFLMNPIVQEKVLPNDLKNSVQHYEQVGKDFINQQNKKLFDKFQEVDPETFNEIKDDVQKYGEVLKDKLEKFQEENNLDFEKTKKAAEKYYKGLLDKVDDLVDEMGQQSDDAEYK